MLKDLIQKASSKLFNKAIFEFPTLEEGNIDPLVLGTNYSQPLLKSLYRQIRDSKTLLTLTPINQYQLKNKWPEPPFVNINLYGSTSTEKDNWLGYIPFDSSCEINFEKILKDQGNVNVHASIHKNHGECWIKLYINDKYKMTKNDYVQMYISHDSRQIKILEKTACELGNDYIKVDIKKEPNKNQYVFIYNKEIIGTASCKKVESQTDKILDKENYLSIKKFRFIDGTDNKHYSKLTIFK